MQAGPPPAGATQQPGSLAAFSRATTRLRAIAGGRAPGGVTRSSSRRRVAAATSSTARSNTAWFAREGVRWPLTFRTNWRAAACTSAAVASSSPRSVTMLRHMSSTLAQGTAGRWRNRLRAGAKAAVVASALAVVVVRGADGDPLLPGRVDALGPAEPGTYRMVGTERDGRTGRSVGTIETFTVEPWFERAGVKHQITRFEEGSAPAGESETAFRHTGAHRLRESADGVSWWWEPPLRTVALPLEVGRSWTSRGTATVPDVAGVRRVTEHSTRTVVAGAATVVVAGRSVRVLVLEATGTTTVTLTDRVDRSVTTTTFTTEGRSWFSPEHMLVVRSARSTTVEGDPARPERYEVVRRAELERLRPG